MKLDVPDIVIPHDFYQRSPKAVAHDLIGFYLLRKDGNHLLAGRIVETEAYGGSEDKASHASAAQSKRAAVMYGLPGHLYVYQIYGIYFCLNIVTEAKGTAGAVLLRAIEPVAGLERMLVNRGRNVSAERVASGPGCLCRALAVDRRLNGQQLRDGTLWVEDRDEVPVDVQCGPRIGVAYAGEWRDKPLRFLDPKSRSVSKQ